MRRRFRGYRLAVSQKEASGFLAVNGKTEQGVLADRGKVAAGGIGLRVVFFDQAQYVLQLKDILCLIEKYYPESYAPGGYFAAICKDTLFRLAIDCKETGSFLL